ERCDQVRAGRVRERDPRRLAARERPGLPVEGEVAQPDLVQEPEPGPQLAQDRRRDRQLVGRERGRLRPAHRPAVPPGSLAVAAPGSVALCARQPVNPRPEIADRERARLRDIEPRDPDVERFRAKLRAAARRARERALVLAQEDADVLLVAALLPRSQEREDAPEPARAVEDGVPEVVREFAPRPVDGHAALAGEGEELRALPAIARLLPRVDRA